MKAIQVQNIKCQGCVAQIKSQLLKIEGLDNLEIDVESQAIVFNDIADPIMKQVVETLSGMGYPLVTENNSIFVKSKSFLSCMIGRTKK